MSFGTGLTILNLLEHRHLFEYYWITEKYEQNFLALTLSQTTNSVDSSKLKGFADDNFKPDKIGRKFPKWVEITVGKGEIARYEQFLLFPQCFQTSFIANTSGLFWESLKPLLDDTIINLSDNKIRSYYKHQFLSFRG